MKAFDQKCLDTTTGVRRKDEHGIDVLLPVTLAHAGFMSYKAIRAMLPAACTARDIPQHMKASPMQSKLSFGLLFSFKSQHGIAQLEKLSAILSSHGLPCGLHPHAKPGQLSNHEDAIHMAGHVKIDLLKSTLFKPCNTML